MNDEFWDMSVEEAMGCGFEPQGDDAGGDLPIADGEWE